MLEPLAQGIASVFWALGPPKERSGGPSLLSSVGKAIFCRNRHLGPGIESMPGLKDLFPGSEDLFQLRKVCSGWKRRENWKEQSVAVMKGSLLCPTGLSSQQKTDSRSNSVVELATGLRGLP
jgi:hypothetical protein